MADFKTALEALGRGDITVDAVTRNLGKLLHGKPRTAERLSNQLREAYGADAIDAESYRKLKTAISEFMHPGGIAVVESNSEENDDATQFDSGAKDRARKRSIVAKELEDASQSQSSPSNVDFGPSTDGELSTGSDWSAPSEPSAPIWTPTGDAATAVKIEPGAILKERFILDEVLGVGGMGTVYKSRDQIKVDARDKNPWVALKVLNEDFKKHPDSFIALQREASRQQKLAHPNIATVYDFDRTGDTVFLTMELLEGVPLNTYIKKTVKPRGGLPFEEAFPIIEGLGHALVYAHEHNIVHSDFKPGNCFITKDNTMKVLDFGIARAVKNPGQLDGEKTLFDPGKLGALTPAYASAEMLDGEDPVLVDDIYALACVAYELFTGQHPFKKLPANDAREKKLVPAPIKILKRRQMKGLMRGLAFTRANRSKNVAEFLEQLEGHRPALKNPFIMLPAAIVLITFAGVYPAFKAYEERQIETQIEMANSGDPAQVQQVLNRLSEFNKNDRNRILVAAREPVLEYFRDAVNQRVNLDQGHYDFYGALALIEEAASFEVFRDSAAVNKLREDVASKERELRDEQNTIFTDALDQGRLLPNAAGDDIHDALAVFSQFDPDALSLLRRRAKGPFGAAIERAMANGEFAVAEELVSTSRELFPEDENLLNLADKLTNERDRVALVAKILILTSSLQDAIDQGGGLAAFANIQKDAAELASIDPNHELLSELTSIIEPLVEADIELLQSARSGTEGYAASRDLLAVDFSGLFRTLRLHHLSAQATQLREEYNTAVGELAARISGEIAAGKLASGTQLLQKLVTLAPTHMRTSGTNDAIALAQLNTARRARAKGDFTAAKTALSKAQALDPGHGVTFSIVMEIDRLTKYAAADNEGQTRLSAMLDAEYSPAATAFKNDLTALPNDAIAIRKVFVALDNLESLSPLNPALAAMKAELASRFSAAAETIGASAGWEEAVALTHDALVYLPESKLILDSLNDIEAKQREATIAADRAIVATRKQEIEALMRDAKADRQWNIELQRMMADIEALADPQDNWLTENRNKIADIYVAKAITMRTTKRFAEADNLLNRAARYAPTFASLSTERQNLETASAAFEREQREQERMVLVEGLKETFATQTRANNVTGAAKTLASLRRELGADDAFVKTEAPPKLARAYYQLATIKATEDEFAAALEFAKAAKKIQPGKKEYTRAVRDYTVDGNVQNLNKIFARGGEFDLAEALDKLGEIQALNSKVFGQSETNWAQAVADRLDGLQSTHGELANPFLEHAKEVFVGNALIAAIEPAGPVIAAPSKYGGEIKKALDAALLSAMRDLLKKATAEEPQHPEVLAFKSAYAIRIKEAKQLYEQYKTNYRAKDYPLAGQTIDQALGVWADSKTFKKEKARVTAALNRGAAQTDSSTSSILPPPPSKNPCDSALAGYGKRKKGTCYDMVAQKARGPLMVVVPAGGGLNHPYAIGKYEITYADYNNYCNLSAECTALETSDKRLPVTGIAFAQAEAYTRWLSARTGKIYRLPNAQEWTHAAEAGGQQPKKDYNCRVEQSGQILKGRSTIGVNTGKANGWGLYNYIGNAQEWVKNETGFSARGGAFEDTFGKCKISLDKPHDGQPDGATGFRILLELS